MPCTPSLTLANHKVMIVEDDTGIREMIRLALEFDGYEVIAARNGEVALGLLRNGVRPDLILLDLMMPVMSGWEFAKVVASDLRLSQIPIVVLTALGDRNEIPENAKALLRKPIKLEELSQVAERSVA